MGHGKWVVYYGKEKVIFYTNIELRTSKNIKSKNSRTYISFFIDDEFPFWLYRSRYNTTSIFISIHISTHSLCFDLSIPLPLSRSLPLSLSLSIDISAFTSVSVSASTVSTTSTTSTSTSDCISSISNGIISKSKKDQNETVSHWTICI